MTSADWMRRNLNNRVETIVPVLDKKLMAELDRILEVYDTDNSSAWDCGPDGVYTLRTPEKGEERRAVQDDLIRLAAEPRKTATAPLAS